MNHPLSRSRFLASLCLLTVSLFSTAFAQDAKSHQPLKICLISGSDEYKSADSLAGLQKHLESHYQAQCTRVFGKDKGKELPGIEALETCDVMILFARRVTLPPDQLAIVKKYLAAGKPIVGIRTASHALQDIPELDHDVLGASYNGHYTDEHAQITLSENASHPVLAGIKPFTTMGKLYKNATLANDTTLLLSGATTSHKEPVAWVRSHNGGRVFYTSLGVPDDFNNENFRQLLVNALFWTANRTPEKKP